MNRPSTPSTAAIANQAYAVILQFAEPTELSTIAEDAVVAAEIAAEDNPGVGPWSTVAQYAYFAGDTKTGDTAGRAGPVGAGVGRPIHPVSPGKPLIQISSRIRR